MPCARLASAQRFDLTCGQTPDKRFSPASRAGVAQLVERVLAKHEVVGSKPITRSMKFHNQFKTFSDCSSLSGASVSADCAHFCAPALVKSADSKPSMASRLASARMCE